MRYRNYENQKRLTLLSKDAVRSNNTFKWNYTKDLGLLTDSTIQVSNFDVVSSSVVPGSTEYVSLPEDNSVSTDNLIAHFKFEDLTDSSSKGSTLTLTNSTIDNVLFRKGYSSLKQINDNNDYVEITPSIEVKECWKNDAITICTWVYLANTSQDFPRLFQFGDIAGGGNKNSFSAHGDASPNFTGLLLICGNDENLLGRYKTDTSVVIPKEKWTHFAWVLEKGQNQVSGTYTQYEATWTVYINGVKNNTLSTEPNEGWFPVEKDLDKFYLANGITGTSNPNRLKKGLVGNLDDFRIYNKALTSDEVSRLIGEVQRLPLIHYKFQNNLTDSSRTTTLTKISGNFAYKTNITKNAEYSLRQNTGIFSITPREIVNNLTNFTISFWANIYEDTGGYQVLYFKANQILFMYNGSNSISLRLSQETEHLWAFNLSSYIDNWTYITLSCDLTVSSVKLYINGLLQTPTTVGGYSTELIPRGTDLSIFSNAYDFNNGLFKAFINDFRFYDKDLSAEEIRTIMYNNTNLLLWYKFEEDLNDTTNKTEITTNTAVLSASPEQQFNQSLDLTGELYTRIPLKIKNGDQNIFVALDTFTITTWLYLENGNHERENNFIFYQGDFGCYGTYDRNTEKINIGLGNSLDAFTIYSFDLPLIDVLQNWIHASFIIDRTIPDSNECQLYINGIKIDGVLLSTNPDENLIYENVSDNFLIGGANLNNSIWGDSFNGFINDFRIYQYRLSTDEVLDIMDYNRTYPTISYTSYADIFKIRCPNVYDVVNTDGKNPLIYHTKGNNKHNDYTNCSFKLENDLNSLSLDITRRNTTYTDLALNESDEFAITFLVNK